MKAQMVSPSLVSGKMTGRMVYYQQSLHKTGEACAEIVFGTPGKHCLGVGICMVIGKDRMKWDKKTCPRVPAAISQQKDGYIAFRFRKDALPAKTNHQHLSQPFFVVEERFSIPLHIARIVGFQRRIWVSPGIYTLLETTEEKVLLLLPESGGKD